MPFITVIILAVAVSFLTSCAAAWNLDRAIFFASKRARSAWRGTSERAVFLAQQTLVPTFLVTLGVALAFLRLCIVDCPIWLTCVLGAVISICAIVAHCRFLSQISVDDFKGEAYGKIFYDLLAAATFSVAAANAFVPFPDVFKWAIWGILLISGISFVSFVNQTYEQYTLRLERIETTIRTRRPDNKKEDDRK